MTVIVEISTSFLTYHTITDLTAPRSGMFHQRVVRRASQVVWSISFMKSAKLKGWITSYYNLRRDKQWRLLHVPSLVCGLKVSSILEYLFPSISISIVDFCRGLYLYMYTVWTLWPLCGQRATYVRRQQLTNTIYIITYV